ncbi:uncharacterized protein JCM6883_001762 [Sporobolomyces salmoneus]|uniref:uncharacterized protein n=1 Tax=Sporobolomyces salmoneus TaxID=183962 RepID=UPI0031789EA7
MKRKIESSGKIWNDWKKFTPGEQCRILVALLDLKGRIAAVQQQNEELRNRKSKGGTRERGTLLPEALTVEDLLNCAQSTERLDPPNSRDISPRFLPVRRQTLYRRRLETRARAEYNRHTRTACSSELGLNAPVTDVPISSVIQSPRYPPTPFDSIPHNQFQHALQNFPSVPTFPSNAIPFPHYHPQPYPIGHRSTPHSSFVPSSQGTLPFDNYQPNPLDPLVNTFGGTHHYPPQAPLDYDPTHDPSHNGPLPASLDPSSYPYGFSQPIAENFHSTPPYWYTPHPNHF